MFLGYTCKDFFIIFNISIILSIIMAASFKFKEKLNKRIDSGQLNKKQAIIAWVELIAIVSISIYSSTIGLYNLVYSFKEEILSPNDQIIKSFLILFKYMKPAILDSLLIVILCFILIKFFKKSKKGGLRTQ